MTHPAIEKIRRNAAQPVAVAIVHHHRSRKVGNNMMHSNDDMWLVYIDSEGNYHAQPWQDMDSVGTLIDPETGDDMELIGWTTSLPEGFSA